MARKAAVEKAEKKVVEKVKAGEDAFDDPELDLLMSTIEKDFGQGSIMSLTDTLDKTPQKHISSGSIALDIALGKGGFVFGRAVEIYGPEGAGKSTICIELIAKAQSLGLRCAYIDKEQALDPEYCRTLGVNLDKIYISQPDTGEDALDITGRLIKSGKFDVIVFDSVAAINPAGDMDKSLSDNAKMAGRAKILTEFFNKNLGIIQKNQVLLVLTNQLRDGLNPYGPKEVTSGGRSLKYSVSQRIEMRPKDKLTDSNGEVIGNTVRVKTVKNRMNVPYKEVYFDVVFGKGIDKLKDLIDVAITYGIVIKGGAWLSFDHNGKEVKVQGMDRLKEMLSGDQELFKYLNDLVIGAVGSDWCKEGK